MAIHILMVDDEPDARELFRQHFRREIRKGVYSFDFAQSGHAALAALEETGADFVALVLSDINMPGMSGVELLAGIRRKWPDLAVIMITAYGDVATEAQVRALGAAHFLNKPVDFGELRSAISQYAGAET